MMSTLVHYTALFFRYLMLLGAGCGVLGMLLWFIRDDGDPLMVGVSLFLIGLVGTIIFDNLDKE